MFSWFSKFLTSLSFHHNFQLQHQTHHDWFGKVAKTWRTEKKPENNKKCRIQVGSTEKNIARRLATRRTRTASGKSQDADIARNLIQSHRKTEDQEIEKGVYKAAAQDTRNERSDIQAHHPRQHHLAAVPAQKTREVLHHQVAKEKRHLSQENRKLTLRRSKKPNHVSYSPSRLFEISLRLSFSRPYHEVWDWWSLQGGKQGKNYRGPRSWIFQARIFSVEEKNCRRSAKGQNPCTREPRCKPGRRISDTSELPRWRRC